MAHLLGVVHCFFHGHREIRTINANPDFTAQKHGEPWAVIDCLVCGIRLDSAY